MINKLNLSCPINVEDIINLIPHRFPMLLVDRILELNEEGAVAIKNVTINEDFFNGHFPGQPIMPGVLIVESMAQAAAVYAVSMMEDASHKLVYFMTINEAHFRKPVRPGDTLHLHITKVKQRGNIWKMKGEAKVGGERVADALFSAMVVDKESAK
jgi:3-hydroxyacyl-[acyl-carrier-protein] dehydratase